MLSACWARLANPCARCAKPRGTGEASWARPLPQEIIPGLVICHWDAAPLKLAGPAWVETHDAGRGYLDRYFTGWVDPAHLKLWDYETLADLLIAFVDDAHDASDTKTLEMLDRRLTGRDETNRSRDNRPM